MPRHELMYKIITMILIFFILSLNVGLVFTQAPIHVMDFEGPQENTQENKEIFDEDGLAYLKMTRGPLHIISDNRFFQSLTYDEPTLPGLIKPPKFSA